MATEPKLLPLVQALGARYDSLTVDSKLVNAFAEKGQMEGELFVYKRPAFVVETDLGAAGTARGLFNWQNNIYAIVDGTVYKNGASIGAVSNAGVYWASSCLGGAPQLFIQNGANAYTISEADVIAAVVDPDYPNPTVSGTAYLDGTTYVLTQGSQIYGSDAAANDPSQWDPLNVLVAQIEPTLAIHMAKHLVYIVAMKQWYTEVFYDAGNATGSPLAPVQGAKMNFGCVDGRTVRDVGGELMWVADSGEGFWCVIHMSNLKVDVVSTPPIERIISSGLQGAFHSWNARIDGHRFYSVTNTDAEWTLVYDFTSKLWYQWTDSDGGYLPYPFSCQGEGADTLFLHASDGKIYRMSTAAYKDEGAADPYPVEIWTPNFDGGTRRNKTLSRMDLLGDQVDTTVSLEWSDDDYATWQGAGNFTFDMSLDLPFVSNLGSFTKRAFKLRHQDDTPFRFRAVEMYLDGGPIGG